MFHFEHDPFFCLLLILDVYSVKSSTSTAYARVVSAIQYLGANGAQTEKDYPLEPTTDATSSSSCQYDEDAVKVATNNHL